jgi:hypothetical protein
LEVLEASYMVVAPVVGRFELGELGAVEMSALAIVHKDCFADIDLG